MKISTITTLFLLLASIQVKAQLTDTTTLKRFTINVLDSINGQPLSDVLLSNPNDRNTFIGDKNGTLDLIVKNDFLQDTLYIVRQNYMTKKISLNAIIDQKTILLTPKSLPVSSIILSKPKNKSVTLNFFERNESNHYLGLSYQLQPFAFLQVAQRFNAAAEGVLNSITLSQLVFLNDKWVREDPRNRDSRTLSYLSMQKSSFKLRIYAADANTGLPKEDLCGEIIEVKNFNNRNLTVNLKPYKITIPKGIFFVAIEWIRNDENLSKTVYNDQSINFNIKSYRPFITISTNEGASLNVYGLTFDNKWELVKDLSPDFTDLAISAEVSY